MGGQASGRFPRRVDLASSFDLACRQAGLTHDAVARLMGITPQHLDDMLRQRRHLSLPRLLSLRDDADGRLFLRAYWPLVGTEMGLPEFADAMDVATALKRFIENLQCRMVKAELVAHEVNDGKKSA